MPTNDPPGRRHASPVPKVRLPRPQAAADALAEARALLIEAIALVAGAEPVARRQADREALGRVRAAGIALAPLLGEGYAPLSAPSRAILGLLGDAPRARDARHDALRHLEQALAGVEQESLRHAHPALAEAADAVARRLAGRGLGCIEVALRAEGDGAAISYRFGGLEIAASAPLAPAGPGGWSTRSTRGTRVLSPTLPDVVAALAGAVIGDLKAAE